MNALETKVLELIGEDADSPDVFVDTDAGMEPIRDSLNDAIQEIVMLTGGHKREYYLPLRQDQAFYRFALNYGHFGWVTDAWLMGQEYRLEHTDLTRLAAYDPRWMVTSGNPRAYIPIGHDIVGFYPKPSGDSDLVELTIVEIPKAYETGTDRVKLLASFEYAAVHYAVAEYWASRGSARDALRYFETYLDALRLRNKFMQSPGQTMGTTTGKAPWPMSTS